MGALGVWIHNKKKQNQKKEIADVPAVKTNKQDPTNH